MMGTGTGVMEMSLTAAARRHPPNHQLKVGNQRANTESETVTEPKRLRGLNP
jgi:hypothetical protein